MWFKQFKDKHLNKSKTSERKRIRVLHLMTQLEFSSGLVVIDRSITK
jgi:hypothetical protein